MVARLLRLSSVDPCAALETKVKTIAAHLELRKAERAGKRTAALEESQTKVKQKAAALVKQTAERAAKRAAVLEEAQAKVEEKAAAKVKRKAVELEFRNAKRTAKRLSLIHIS